MFGRWWAWRVWWRACGASSPAIRRRSLSGIGISSTMSCPRRLVLDTGGGAAAAGADPYRGAQALLVVPVDIEAQSAQRLGGPHDDHWPGPWG